MNLNNNHTNLPMEPNESSFAQLQIFNNECVQHNLNDNTGGSNINLSTLNINTINTETFTSQNTTFEFYFHLPNDTHIYRIQQRAQQPVQQQSFDAARTQDTSQMYLETTSIGNISNNMQCMYGIFWSF
ncbi:hypothetical protein GLOIN_2v1781313 [Rhizophagus clarus]|uniref:Uncharacterized protein n=1 Tax=Rhizophagus clarus TaxID=94130 RepID=A0A8H3KUC5_9GLOM|nr:hypothetical protein GLOIN_2v1781313 [Rhizophagus clarus]